MLNAVIETSANHFYDVDFMTTDVRKHRDEARALAARAAMEKTRELASYGRLRNGACSDPMICS